MRLRSLRHLSAFLATPEFAADRGKAPPPYRVLGLVAPPPAPPEKPPELTWRDFAIMLLQIGSAVEHALMVQYLYAAYSLGGPGVEQKDKVAVQHWQDEILAIAKEEMGHLLTAQNVLRLLGGPASLDREDYPWDSPFYPFAFRLEPLTLGSLACYVFAEMPADWEGDEADEIKREVQKHIGSYDPERPDAHHVGRLYRLIIDILANPDYIGDADFDDASYLFQASWDEWGRGYKAGARDAAVLIEAVATRTDAVDALTRLAAQGEAPHLRPQRATGAADDDTPSHFDRFLAIYRDFKRRAAENGPNWKPSRPVAVNPTTPLPSVDDQRGRDNGTSATAVDYETITDKVAVRWASLFNLRYRMLLTYLTHAFQLERQNDAGSHATLRGAIMHRVFQEMYNLKAIAGLLVRLPLTHPATAKRAGPPFQMPYTLSLPLGELDGWRLHRDLLDASADICHDLANGRSPSEEERNYLASLRATDASGAEWLDKVIAGLVLKRSYAV